MPHIDHSQRPAVITVQPTAAVRPMQWHDVRPLVLPPQSPCSAPTAHGWEMLPATTGPLIVDFTGQSIIYTAMLLTDLNLRQRRQQQIPILLVPEAALAQQRVIAAADLRAIIVPTDQPTMLERWLHAPVVVGTEPIWVGLTPPAAPAHSPHFVPLFAALSRAANVAQAATWCALSARRAYDVLAESAHRLALPAVRWRMPGHWVGALCRALVQRADPPTPASLEVSMDFRGFDVIAATLCGCVIEQIHRSGTTLRIVLHEPRQGRMTLVCRDATLDDEYGVLATLTQRPEAARTIDWVDVLPDFALQICFPDQTELTLRTSHAVFERCQER